MGVFLPRAGVNHEGSTGGEGPGEWAGLRDPTLCAGREPWGRVGLPCRVLEATRGDQGPGPPSGRICFLPRARVEGQAREISGLNRGRAGVGGEPGAPGGQGDGRDAPPRLPPGDAGALSEQQAQPGSHPDPTLGRRLSLQVRRPPSSVTADQLNQRTPTALPRWSAGGWWWCRPGRPGAGLHALQRGRGRGAGGQDGGGTSRPGPLSPLQQAPGRETRRRGLGPRGT